MGVLHFRCFLWVGDVAVSVDFLVLDVRGCDGCLYFCGIDGCRAAAEFHFQIGARGYARPIFRCCESAVYNWPDDCASIDSDDSLVWFCVDVWCAWLACACQRFCLLVDVQTL